MQIELSAEVDADDNVRNMYFKVVPEVSKELVSYY